MLINPIKIDNGFFISSLPTTEKDAKMIADLGIKQVIFLYGNKELAKWETQRLFKRFNIRVEAPPHEFGMGEYESVLSIMKKPCLVHCYRGGSSQDIAVAYWMARGLSPAKAMAIVQRVLRSNNVKIRLSKLEYFRELQKEVFDPKLAKVQLRIEAARAARLSKRFDRAGRIARQRNSSRIKRNVGRRI